MAAAPAKSDKDEKRPAAAAAAAAGAGGGASKRVICRKWQLQRPAQGVDTRKVAAVAMAALPPVPPAPPVRWDSSLPLPPLVTTRDPKVFAMRALVDPQVRFWLTPALSRVSPNRSPPPEAKRHLTLMPPPPPRPVNFFESEARADISPDFSPPPEEVLDAERKAELARVQAEEHQRRYELAFYGEHARPGRTLAFGTYQFPPEHDRSCMLAVVWCGSNDCGTNVIEFHRGMPSLEYLFQVLYRAWRVPREEAVLCWYHTMEPITVANANNWGVIAVKRKGDPHPGFSRIVSLCPERSPWLTNAALRPKPAK